ncbi:MAG: sugar phosphate isomerase/epimerase [Oscillospiraceae bacterium]|jgi:sugar phosphate isomerase/epimerase|nr:sugar phosphate isomerase/epimerase [Oscillospiraceae bacterium]
MRNIGISSSCFYPLETEKAFQLLAENGIKTAEIFINAKSELQKSFLDELNAIRNHYGIRVTSLHPYSSFAENFMLFSSYKRRFEDFFADLPLHFEAARLLGAKYYVVHGIRLPGSIADGEYFERFAAMIALGKKFGVLPVQENVVNHRSESPAFLLKMKEAVGEDFKMVLDTKQALRAGHTAFEFVEKLGGSICHVHISDYSQTNDCITPLRGQLDFQRLFREMERQGYDGDYIIELYNNGFRDICELKGAVAVLSTL